MSHLPYDTFRETLAIRYPNCGHALWEPSSGGLYDSVEVGDVGFIREGCFHRLFNVFLPKEHPSHSNFGVPEDHQQLPLNVPNHIHKVRDGTDDFCSRHVSLVSNERNVHAWGPDDDPQVTVTCPGRRGAMLSLPSRAQREDTIARGAFGKWMVKHIDLWVAFAETLGLGVNRMQDIILVTGRHCAKSWINVAFSDSHRDAEVSFGVRLSGSSGVTVERRAVRGDATLKLGPSGEDLPENQCIFVRGFRVVRMWNIWPRLRGGAGPPSDTGGNDPEFGNDKFLEPLGSPFDTSFPDPLHVLLQYIAEKAPDCDIALIHDDDLACISGANLDSLKPDTLIEHLRVSSPEIRQVPCVTLPGSQGGVRDAVIAKMATLSRDEFPLETGLSTVPSAEGRMRTKPLPGNIKKKIRSLFSKRSSRATTPDPSLVDDPPQGQKQGVGLELQKVALKVLSSQRSKSSDLSKKVSKFSESATIEGNTLTFYLGEWINDGDHAALGCLRDQSPASQKHFKKYIEASVRLQDRNVLRVFGYATIEGIVYSVSPWMENGNIREYVGRNQNADRMRLLSEVASGMEFLHEKGIVHGDLCGKSILINDEGKAFVSGFDLSESLDPNSRVRWLAPEMIAPEGVAPTTEDTDIWSFGLLCLEVFTGEDPYLPYSDLLVPVLLKNGMTPQHPGPMAVDLNPEMWALMESCWRMNPAERPGMSTIQSTIRSMLPRLDLAGFSPRVHYPTPPSSRSLSTEPRRDDSKYAPRAPAHAPYVTPPPSLSLSTEPRRDDSKYVLRSGVGEDTSHLRGVHPSGRKLLPPPQSRKQSHDKAWLPNPHGDKLDSSRPRDDEALGYGLL